MGAAHISPLPAPRKPAIEAAAPAQRKAQAGEKDAHVEGGASATDFSQLLQAAAVPDAAEVVATSSEISAPLQGKIPADQVEAKLDGISVPMSTEMTWVAPGLMGQVVLPLSQHEQTVDMTVLGQQGAVEVGSLPAQMTTDMAWAAHSLVGQTARLDQSADIALRNGTHVQEPAYWNGGHALGAMRLAGKMAWSAARQVPLVAQGVVSVAEGSMSPAGALAAGQAAVSSMVSEAAQMLGEAVADGAVAGEEDAGRVFAERGADGRVTLQGAWNSPDRTAPPSEVMQRLLGQMSQFLAATGAPEVAGGRRSVGKSGDEAGVASDGVLSSPSSGVGVGAGRLLDTAVAQAAAGQQAAGPGAQDAGAEPEMAYWMNARQQRAEVVLDRAGEPVRVQVTLDGQTAHVAFRSDEQATRAMLDASVAQLRDMLASQGVELASVQVDAQASGRQQEDAHDPSERFMPEGARRMRLDMPEGAEPVRAASAGRTGRQGVDIFA